MIINSNYLSNMVTTLAILITLYCLAGILTACTFGDKYYPVVNTLLFIFWPIMWIYTVKKFREYNKSKK